MIDTLKNDQIEALLAKQLVGRIGCCAEGQVYIVPVSYAYDGECIYVHTHEGMKLSIMRKNPQVCFETDNTHDMANWQSIIAWGTFEELREAAEREQALHILNNRMLPLKSSSTTHLGSYWPFSDGELHSAPGVVFRIRLEKKTGRFETNSEEPSFHY